MMQNPIKKRQKIKKTNSFLKRFAFSFILVFIFVTLDYKSGSVGEARKAATYYKPTPNSWNYVYDHLPDIILVSFCGALPFAILISPFVQDM